MLMLPLVIDVFLGHDGTYWGLWLQVGEWEDGTARIDGIWVIPAR